MRAVSVLTESMCVRVCVSTCTFIRRHFTTFKRFFPYFQNEKITPLLGLHGGTVVTDVASQPEGRTGSKPPEDFAVLEFACSRRGRLLPPTTKKHLTGVNGWLWNDCRHECEWERLFVSLCGPVMNQQLVPTWCCPSRHFQIFNVKSYI